MDATGMTSMFNFDDIEAKFFQSLAVSAEDANSIERAESTEIESKNIEIEDTGIIGQSTSFAVFDVPPSPLILKVPGVS